ncbi:unnamed protein product [Musa acuminata subsp. burmannicoides]
MASTEELEERLRDVGERLASPPTDVGELLSLLDETESLLLRVQQSPSQSLLDALRPTMNLMVEKKFLEHPDEDVKVIVASCTSEITRITAPNAPYDDDLMKVVFQKIVDAFENLDDTSSRSFSKRVSILETVAKVQSCIVMLDLECDAMILDMFHIFLRTIRPNHSENIFCSMGTIMTVILEESEDISPELLSCLLDSVKNDNKDILPIARRLAERVIADCALKLKPYLVELAKSKKAFLSKYSRVVASVCQEYSDQVEQNDMNSAADAMADDSKLSKKTESSQKRKSELSGHGNQMKNKRAANRDCSAILGLKAGRLDDTSGPKNPGKPAQVREPDQSIVGLKIKVWWPDDKRFYDGTVEDYDRTTKKHKILYDDGDVEVLLLKNERWDFIGDKIRTSYFMGQTKDDFSPDASSDKRAKKHSNHVARETNVGTPVKSGTHSSSTGSTEIRKRKGRPPKVANSNHSLLSGDDSPNISSKSKEKAPNKPKDDVPKSGTKLKKDGEKAKEHNEETHKLDKKPRDMAILEATGESKTNGVPVKEKLKVQETGASSAKVSSKEAESEASAAKKRKIMGNS